MRTAVTRYVTPALLALGVILAIANWYLTPERSRAWAITLGLLVFLVVPLAIARRLRSRGILSPSTDQISSGVGFAALMMVIALSGKLLQTLGVIDDQSLSRRLTMALVGVLLAMIGNATPKRLTPLSALGVRWREKPGVSALLGVDLVHGGPDLRDGVARDATGCGEAAFDRGDCGRHASRRDTADPHGAEASQGSLRGNETSDVTSVHEQSSRSNSPHGLTIRNLEAGLIQLDRQRRWQQKCTPRSADIRGCQSLVSTQRLSSGRSSSQPTTRLPGTDLQETITSWNQAAERLYGYSAAETIGKSNRMVIPPDRSAEEDAVVQRLRAGEGVQHFETARIHKNGSRVDVAITASAIRDDGSIIGISKIARDISSRKESERNGARLAAIVESSDDAIIGKDLNGVITTWNPAAERIFGYPAQEAVGQSIRLIIPESHQDEEDMILGSIKRGESVQHFETIRCRKDGSCFPISVTVSPIRNKAGVIIGASKIARDISDRKHAEAEAKRAQRQAAFVARMAEVMSGSLDYEARLKDLTRLAVPSIADWAAVDVLETDGHIRRVAVAHADPTKTQLDAEIQRHHEDPAGPCNARQVIRTGNSVLVEDIRADMIITAAKGDDERTRSIRALGLASCMCVPLKNHGTTAALTLATAESARRYNTDDLRFAQDVASRAAMMVDNARAYADLRKASRLKDEFLATLSHELRTPLNAILGYARMLRAGMVTPDKFQRTFETIERNTSALTQMVEEILDVSRVVSGKMRLNMQPVELPIVLNEAVATVIPAAEAKDIRVVTTMDPQVGPVSGDPDRLRQIVWNLLSNAVKFTPKHGRIQVRLERVNSSVEIVVSDTGIGIAPDFLPHMFEQFRQADSGPARQHGGLGLGLAIVRNLAELHGGTVYAASGGKDAGSDVSRAITAQNCPP